jgi:Tfp pilus assembly protein PilE
MDSATADGMVLHMRLRPRIGFSLVEMTFIFLVVGVLTLIAVPKIREMKRRAYVSMLTHDLRNVTHVEELHWEDADSYTNNLAVLRIQPSADVILTIVEATKSGYSATAEHLPSGTHCAVFAGSAAPVAPATVKMAIACVWP